jgi:hypothetical protein
MAAASAGLGEAVVRELGALDGRLTPAAWRRAHPGDSLRRFEFDPFLQTGAAWCVEAVARQVLPGRRMLTRRAVFYPPSVADTPLASLPPLPLRPDSALAESGCRLALVLIAVSSSASGGALVAAADSVRQALARRYGSADTTAAVRRYHASGRWRMPARWRAGARTIVTAYAPGDPTAERGAERGPRVLAFAFLPASQFGRSIKAELAEDHAAYRATQRADSATFERALALAAGEPAATNALRELYLLGYSHAWNPPPEPRPDTLVVPPLRHWLAATAHLPPPQRAAALLAADRALALTAPAVDRDSPADSGLAHAITKTTEARYVVQPIGGGYTYAGNWLRAARATAPTSPAGELALLTQLETGFIEPVCGGDPAGEHFRRVIAEGEAFLARTTDRSWQARAHLAVADAYRDIVALAAGVVESFGGDPARYRAEAPAARERAVANYRAVLALGPVTSDGAATDGALRRVWSETWRLLAHLTPADTRFVCVYD